MSRGSELYLSDAASAIAAIREYLAGEPVAARLLASPMVRDAVVRNIEVIGEAIKHLPEELTALQQHVDWGGWARLRDVLAHQYFGVDIELLADALETELPALERAISLLQGRTEAV
ncbi:MAG: HepT-like ribonuclease domain-containing protein [Thermoanaerobaculia bacterium]